MAAFAFHVLVGVALFALVEEASARFDYYTQILAGLGMSRLIIEAIKATEFFLLQSICFASSPTLRGKPGCCCDPWYAPTIQRPAPCRLLTCPDDAMHPCDFGKIKIEVRMVRIEAAQLHAAG